MNGKSTLVLACGIALLVAAGCAKNPKQSSASLKPTESGAAAVASAPAVAPDRLAGAWRLAIPRADQMDATIKFTDGAHVAIQAGEHLSGDYVVQGQYLLILTHDERMRPLAWRINSPDSLTVVRSPEMGTMDFTGVTLVRAASDASEDEAVSVDVDEMP